MKPHPGNKIKTQSVQIAKIFTVISLLLFNVEVSVAQTANLTLTVTSAHYVNWYSGNPISGCDFYTQYIYVRAGDKYLGSLRVNDESATYTLSCEEINITAERKTTLTFNFGYRHYCWGSASGKGSGDGTIFKEYPLTIQFNENGTLDQQETAIFDQLPDSEPAFVTFDATLSPFQPGIIGDDHKKCANSPFDITANKNEPYDYNVSCVYEWQYGLTVPDIKKNDAFDSFINQIANEVRIKSEYCSSGEYGCPDQPSAVYDAIAYADYEFLTPYLDWYNNYDMYKSAIANMMLSEIMRQYYYSLTGNDKAFLSGYFQEIFDNYSTTPAPYIIGTKEDWKPLANNAGLTINFDPATKLDPLTGFTRVNFRVRAFSGTSYGPFSATSFRDVLPAPPKAALISTTESCLNGETGTITLTGISSFVPTNSYTYRITDTSVPDHVTPDDQSHWSVYPEIFTGPDYTITGQKPGDYKLYLTYNDPNIANCFVAEPFTIETLPDLNFSVTKTDISCPETSDGKIQFVNVTGVSPFIYYLNNEPTSAEVINMASGGYTVSMTDGCIADPAAKRKNITLYSPNPVEAKINFSKNPNCISNANGGFELKVTGGTNGLYDYYIYTDVNGSPSGSPLISSTGKSGTWSNYSLPGGKYIIYVKDNANPQCLGVAIQSTLIPATPLSLSAPVITPVRCYGDQTGAIEITASGGSLNYTYSLEGTPLVQTSNKFNNLFAGTYYVVVRNADGSCSDSERKEAKVTSNPKLGINLTSQDVRCSGEENGQIKAVVSGGTGINTFESDWEIKEDGAWELYDFYKDILTDLSPGEYRLKIKDNAGCTMYKETIVNEPAELTIKSLVPHGVRCYGENGSIELQADGGNGGYSFLYSTDAVNYTTYQSGSPLPADTYILKVKDIKGCEAQWSEEVTITTPQAALDFSSTVSDYNGFNISCTGGSNGSITVLAGGGTTGYTYSLDGYPLQTNPTFTGVSAGTRNLKVTDAHGCEVIKSVKLSEPDPLILSATAIDNIPCYGLSTGSLNLEATGGTGAYTYQKGAGVFQSAGKFTNLPAAMYHLTVQDENGCQNSIDTEVKHLYSRIETILTPEDIKCFGEDNGRIDALITGGSGNFDLLWEQKTNGSWQTRQAATTSAFPLQPAQYRLTVTDQLGCPAIRDSAWVYQPDTPVSIGEVTLHDIRCFGEKGSIDIIAEGGTGDYQYFYSRNSGANQSYLPGSSLEAGTYHLFTHDDNGCEASWSDDITITTPSQALDYSYSLSDYNGFNVSCFGSNNGSITVTAWGGNDAAYQGYSYLLNTKPVQTDAVFTDIAAGGYQLTVNDARGCSVTHGITLTQPAASVNIAVADLKDSKCFNDSSGVVALSVTGGVYPFTYSIEPDDFVATSTFSGLPVGEYRFTVKDMNGCTNSIDTVIRHILPRPIISLTPQEISCYGHYDGQIEATLTGGSGNFAFEWQRKMNGSWRYATSGSSKIIQLAPGEYRLRATDEAGCPSIYDSTTVVQRVTPLVIDNVSLHEIICYGDKGSIDIQASGSNGGYIYQYSEDKQDWHNYIPGDPLTHASYYLRVLDLKGCETSWPEVQTITTPPQALGFTLSLKDFNGYNVSCFGNNDGQLTVNSFGGNGNNFNGYTYKLSDHEAQSDPVFNALTAGSYDITVTDARGCSVSKPVILTQAVSELKLWATSLKQVTCHYDKDGEIALAVSGGKAPYTYRIANEPYVEQSGFSGLPVGTYRFTVKDVNGCLQLLDTSFVNTVPKMEITGKVTHVKCFGENNGMVDVTVNGGASPFAFSWKEKTASTRNIDQLYKGIYNLSVTDAKGCREERHFEVREPKLPLSVTATSEMACAQTPNGIIHPQAVGGTQPYYYSIDGASDVRRVDQLLSYGGTYTVFAADSNNCRTTTQVTVGVRNEMPSPNFMVATSRYALDTLVIKDVSVPRPDNITWVFPPDASVIVDDPFEPMIKYNEAGIYPVKMIGHFGTCDYEVEKMLTIAPFDPDAVVKDNYHKGIESVEISPNPNNGVFKVKVKLYNRQQVRLRVIDVQSTLLHSESFPACIDLERDISLPGAHHGMYILWVVTDTDSRAIRFVVSE